MELKQGQLVAILGCTKAIEDKWISSINSACGKFSINTKLRLAAFIAQIGHESGRLTAVTENLNYSASGLQSTWPNRFNSTKAQECARQPEKIANVVYSGRMGNAAEASGDGWKYRGRGLIQCTGKSNYDAFSQACGVNAVADPDSLTQPANAALSAGWFWNSKGLNAYADRGDLLTTTKRINGGTNGQADREALYKRALIVLSDETPPGEGTEEAKKPVEVAPDATSPIVANKTPAATNASIAEPRSAGSSSQYPWNAVHESRSGHVLEIDDTPGAERLASTHRTGSYWEVNPVGSFTIKSVLDSFKITKEDSSDYVGGSYTQQTKGQSYRQSSGNMIFSTPSEVYFTASMMQFNTGALNVSGEVNASGMNAPIFSGLGSSMAYGDMLAKESLVAYDIKKGKPPMLGGSLGFKGVAGGSEGSADSRVSNNLSTNKPDGTPIVTNGISPNIAALVAAGVAVVALSSMKDTAQGLIDGSGSDSDTPTSKAIIDASESLDRQASLDDSQTPVFLKHVSFDKPTLLSQSTVGDAPDPSLFVNNYHTIVDAAGVGRLHVSDGTVWIPVGNANAVDYSEFEDQVNIIKDSITDLVNLVLDDADGVAAAFAESALTTQVNLANALLAEAVARGAAVQAESWIRQTEYESIAVRLLEITSSTSDQIASAIQVVQTATSDLVSAEAEQRTLLAATVNGHTSSIMEEIETRANQTGDLFSQYSIKINQDGYVSGFGLSSTTNNAVPYSNFVILADSFLIASPATYNMAPRTVFNVRSTPTTINGVAVPAGVYMDSAFISVIQAGQIDSRGLSIKDSNGNVILSAGSSVATSTFGGNIVGTVNGVNAATLTANAASALTLADSASTSAIAANALLADIASDSKLTAVEKLNIRNEWNIIVSEKAGLNANIATYAVTSENTAYNNALQALGAYMNADAAYTISITVPPSWINDANLSVTTPIVGATFRANWKAVYDTRQALLNKVSIEAGKFAQWANVSGTETVTANINTALTNATSALNSADAANLLLADIASDAKLTPAEKQAIRVEWNIVMSEKAGISANSAIYPASAGENTAYDAALVALGTYLNNAVAYTLNVSVPPTWINDANLSVTTTIVGSTFRATWKALYDARQALLNKIAAEAGKVAIWSSVSGTGRPEDYATVGAPAGTLINGVSVESVTTSITNFNASNDRNGAAIATPTIVTTGAAIDHTARKDGAVDISFEWVWGGNEADIDGFIVYVYTSATATPYVYPSNPTSPDINAYVIPASKRVFISYGSAADMYYTFAVRAYRSVDKDVNATGLIQSTIAQPGLSTENPYQPSTTVAFLGDVTGTVNGTPAATLVTNATAALSTATTANSTANAATLLLTDIANDDKLTATEKQSTRYEWNIVVSEKAGINTTAGVYPAAAAENTAYNTAFQALGTYLNAGVAYTISTTVPPTWINDANLSTTTVIVGATFRANWKAMYDARQALLNDIAVEAGKVALWSSVTGTGKPEDNATSGAPAGTLVNGVSAATVTTAVANFNASNDRNSAVVVAPTIVGTGTAIDHTIRKDGAADISFEWVWGGSEADIDGFIVYVYCSATATPYVYPSNPTSPDISAYVIPASKRVFFNYGAASDQYYTFAVRAYRSVDKDINAASVILSTIAQSALAEENPYQPSSSVAFSGDLLGTINGTASSTVVANAANGATAFTGTVAYRTAGAPTNNPVITGSTGTQTSDGNVLITLSYTYTQGSVKAEQLFIYISSDVTVNSADPCYTTNAASGSFSFIVKPSTNYYLGIQAARSSEAGVVGGTIVLSGLVTSMASNFTATINGVAATDITDAVADFNASNNRIATAVIAPTILSDATAVDHVIRTDGSVDISLEWAWSGAEGDIDGFGVYVRQSTSAASYTFGTNPAEEVVYQIPANRRAFVVFGAASNAYYTFGVMAYRAVDKDVSATGVITSTLIKPSLAAENPYRPAATVAFAGDVTGTINGIAATNVNQWGSIAGAGKPANGATVGAPAGTFINGVAVETVTTSVTNFNNSNDRNSTAVVVPTILNTGAAIDHTIQTDGSADISFEWVWGGTDGDIDGFQVYVYQSTSSSAYTFGTTAAYETVYVMPANKRSFILYGTAADKYYTFGVRAYRSVDKDINATGVIASVIVKSTYTGENPYLPSTSVAFSGNVTGTVNNIAAVDLNVWSQISGTGKPANGATVGATFGTNINGQITTSSASTYIADAAIGSAQVGTLTANNIDARGLSILDNAGNVILSAGSTLKSQILANAPDQLKNNLLDASTWTINTHGSVPGFVANGGELEQYRNATTLPDGTTGISWYCYPGIYYNNAYGWDPYKAGGVAAGDTDGGWNTDDFVIDKNRGYRFSVWWKHEGGNIGTAYLGCLANSVYNMNTTTLNDNPYFATIPISSLVVGRWYLAVGYVYPTGESGVTQRGQSGIYDGTNGQKIYSGTDFVWASTAIVSKQRSYLYYSAVGSHLHMTWPRVEMVNGAEPSLSQLLAMGSVSARNPINSGNATTYIANLAVNTLQIANNAVTVSRSSSGVSPYVSTTLYIPANQTMRVTAIGFFATALYTQTTNSYTLTIDGNSISEYPYYSLEGGGVVYKWWSMTLVHMLDVSGGTSGRTITVSVNAYADTNTTKTVIATGFLK